MLISEEIDILCVTETWLAPSKPDSVVNIPGYNIFRRDRGSTNCSYSNLGGGGVAIYAKSTHQTARRVDLECSNNEVVSIEVNSRISSQLILAIYRPPRQSVENLKSQFQLLEDELTDHDILICGDFNAYNSSWNDKDSTNTNGRALQVLFDEYGLLVCNKHMGTRPTDNSNHLVDLILSNCPHNIISISTTTPLSDHCPVLASLKTSLAITSTKTKKYVRRFNLQKIRLLLTTEPLLERVQGDVPIEYAWHAWESHFLDVVQRSSYWTAIPDHGIKPWYSNKLYRLKRCQDRLYRRYIRSPSSTNKLVYNICRNAYRKKVRSARDSYLNQSARYLQKGCRTGGYTWWKRAKRFCNISQKSHNIPDLIMDDKVAQSPKDKAQMLANYFAAQCFDDSTAPEQPRTVNATGHDDSLFTLPYLSTDEVFHKLSHLSLRTATSDREYQIVLKIMADLTCDSLTYIYNRSIETASFPSAWKVAIVTPIYKHRGDPASPDNYRPISLLSTITRIFEEQLSISFSNYLHENNLISPAQFGYLRHRSTTLQLLLLVHEIAYIRDSSKLFNCVFLDLCKAFDQVHQPNLLNALTGIASANTVKWFESYLTHRSIQVRVEGTLSQARVMNRGVPQGSHLAPLLFILYVNCLPKMVTYSKPFMYADDVVLLHEHIPGLSSESNINNLEHDLESCQQWALSSRGTFSPAKTTVLTNANILPQIRFCNKVLSISDTVRHLGLYITASLNFDSHFQAIKAAFTQRVNLLCYMGRYLPGNAILTLYKAYVRPAIEYSAAVWCFTINKTHLKLLDILQARVCRRFLRSSKIAFDPLESKENLNLMCGLQSLEYRRQYISLVILFKIIHLNPEYLARFKIMISSSARRPNKLVFNAHGRHMSKLFFHSVGRLWNSLPAELTAINSLAEFKTQLLKHSSTYHANCNGIPKPINT